MRVACLVCLDMLKRPTAVPRHPTWSVTRTRLCMTRQVHRRRRRASRTPQSSRSALFAPGGATPAPAVGDDASDSDKDCDVEREPDVERESNVEIEPEDRDSDSDNEADVERDSEAESDSDADRYSDSDSDLWIF